MLIHCPHCHDDFSWDIPENVKETHSEEDMTACPNCGAMVSLLDTSERLDPEIHRSPHVLQQRKQRRGLADLIPPPTRRFLERHLTSIEMVLCAITLVALMFFLDSKAFTKYFVKRAELGVAGQSSDKFYAVAARAQKAVGSRVRNAGKARFPPLDEVQVKDIGGKYYKVDSWVDEVDDRGNATRVSYVCTLKERNTGYILDKLVIGNDFIVGEK